MNPTELWNAWRTAPEIQEIAEGWITKPAREYTEDDDRFYALLRQPDRCLACIFAVMQLTDDPEVLGRLGAGLLENFLGVHGETYVDTMHTLALEHRKFRVVLNDVWQGAMPKRVWHRIEILKQSAFS